MADLLLVLYCQSEVPDLATLVVVEEKIGRLDIEVQDMVRMKELESLQSSCQYAR